MKTPPRKISSTELSAICHFRVFCCLNTASSCSMTSSEVKEMVAARPVADGQTTHPLPPLGLYVTLYKAFLSVSQAWCVYTALGAYPQHWLFEPRWRFRGSTGTSSRNSERPTVLDLWSPGHQPRGSALLLNNSVSTRTPPRNILICANMPLFGRLGMQVEYQTVSDCR